MDIHHFTNHTCGPACWEAKDDVCRCECGGKNHGCLRSPDGVRPIRRSKIDGLMYELDAVGQHKICADKLLKELPPRKVMKVNDQLTYTYHWGETDPGSPYRVKCATKIQIAKWPELAAYRDLSQTELYFKPVRLRWKLTNSLNEMKGKENELV